MGSDDKLEITKEDVKDLMERLRAPDPMVLEFMWFRYELAKLGHEAILKRIRFPDDE